MKNNVINGIEIVSLEKRLARVGLRSALAGAEISASENLTARASQFWHEGTVNVGKDGTHFNYERATDVLPTSDDYVTVRFRAISKSVIPGHWIDWSKGDVLKSSVPKLLGQTVYPNHDFTDINNWLGSVSSVEWDDAGAESGGVPGINAEYKIDALMNPRIARGLLMKPPAIHSTSMTVLFKYEYSHPEIAAENRHRFFDMLGEEVEGEIVRFIVTEILEYWEASLVFQGADRLAKQQTGEQDFADMSADAAGDEPPANSNEEKTMKLSNEQKTKLGIEFDGEDVPETEILAAAEQLAERVATAEGTDVAELQRRAELADTLLNEKRANVVRLAVLAELGAETGELDPAIAEPIAEAGPERLDQLSAYYEKKAAERFAGNRSSDPGSKAIEDAGGVGSQEEELPEISVL